MKTMILNTFGNTSKAILLSAILLSGVLWLSSCDSDDVDNLYTFTDKMMGEYLLSDTTYSEFYKIIEKTKVKGLLNSYGTYTCFVPTNEALRTFYRSKGKKSVDDFSLDSLKTIAYNHLINGAIYNYASFNTSTSADLSMSIADLTMSEKHLTVKFVGAQAFVNDSSKILIKDIVVYNGVLHSINKVIEPTNFGLSLAIKQDSSYSVFYEAFEKTGLADSLYLIKDDSYSLSASYKQFLEDAVTGNVLSTRVAPTSRKYGYTVLVESNSTLAANGITDLESIKQYAADIYNDLYPEDAGIKDITNRRNSLNRFIAYHIIKHQIDYNHFIDAYDTDHLIKTKDMFEYIKTMCPNTLIEVKKDRLKPLTFLINYTSIDGKYIEIIKSNQFALNGVFHEISNVLAYTRDVRNEMSSKRLRFDFASLFPELTNNNMRGHVANINDGPLYRFAIPPSYLDNLKCNNDQTVIGYSTPNTKLMNYQGDEFFVKAVNNTFYDFEVTTLPIPEGNYEVRFGYQGTGGRGVCQFYLDGIPCGVPVNLNKTGVDISVGYVTPGSDPADPYGYENDKMMRNRGYMKGPASFKAISQSWYPAANARYHNGNLRKILGTYSLAEGEHVIAVKGLADGQFQIDFIEFVPTSTLEIEDIN